jgi:hypothetical protein
VTLAALSATLRACCGCAGSGPAAERRVFWGFMVPRGCLTHTARLLQGCKLNIVFHLERTLMDVVTTEELQARIKQLKEAR